MDRWPWMVHILSNASPWSPQYKEEDPEKGLVDVPSPTKKGFLRGGGEEFCECEGPVNRKQFSHE